MDGGPEPHVKGNFFFGGGEEEPRTARERKNRGLGLRGLAMALTSKTTGFGLYPSH